MNITFKRQTMAALLMACLPMYLSANPITRAEARQTAMQMVGIDDHSNDNNAPLAPYYIFSRGQGQGFVIVSGDDSTAPILGYTDCGDFDRDALPPQLTAMLDDWQKRLTTIQSRRQRPLQKAPRARAVADYKSGWTDVAPLIKTHWHQSSPYNDLAPLKDGQRCMTGCVATAGSQVTYYFHKDNPNALQYDTPTYGYGTPITVSLPAGTPIEWSQMKLSGSGNERQNKAVATLMYALGTSAWLTYGDGEGLATSGHNEKMAEAMRGQFNLNSSHKWKTEYSQQGWEELIYRNLASRRPMLYSGAHPDNGGHSVVLDGYQARTGLYHFNFGWGGQGDGYYTVDDATGMNGFNTYQDLVFDITPKQQNLAGELLPTQLYHKMNNEVTVSVTNQGTLDYSGFYLYTNTSDKMPTGSAAATETSTLIEPGKTVQLTFNLKPSQQKTQYVFLCGKNKQVIASTQMEVLPTVADLRLNSITVDASNEVTEVDGMAFNTINNTTANVTVNLSNGPEGTICQPVFRCFVDAYQQQDQTWKMSQQIILNGSSSTNEPLIFEAGETRDVVFTFTNLKPDVLYRAYLDKPAVASTQRNIQFLTADSVVYFTVRTSDLSIVANGRTATVSGRWNAALFTQLATDASVCSYDISNLRQLDSQPRAANPNAVFYATADATDWLQYDNVVAGNECKHLSIVSNADFMPSQPFTAHQADFVLQESDPAQWHTVLMPFEADVPYGMQVKQPQDITSNSLNYQFTQRIPAMTPVLYLTSRTALNTIVSFEVPVSTTTEATAFDGIMQASTVATPLPSQSLVPGSQIGFVTFVKPASEQTTAKAFQPILTNQAKSSVSTTNDITIDGYYRLLASAINEAYNALDEEPGQPDDARQTLLNIVKEAEDLLTSRSHTEAVDIKNLTEQLKTATRDFRNGKLQGIDIISNTPNLDGTRADCFTLSGQRIRNTQGGGRVIIVRQGTQVRKLLQ